MPELTGGVFPRNEAWIVYVASTAVADRALCQQGIGSRRDERYRPQIRVQRLRGHDVAERIDQSPDVVRGSRRRHAREGIGVAGSGCELVGVGGVPADKGAADVGVDRQQGRRFQVEQSETIGAKCISTAKDGKRIVAGDQIPNGIRDRCPVGPIER